MRRAEEGTEYRELLKRALRTIDELQVRLEAQESVRAEPIAVVGVGLRFPGGVSDPAAFWEMLKEGRDAISDVPPSRWDADAFYDADLEATGKAYVQRGGFLDSVDTFDPGFFNISPREAESMDPQHRLLLEVAWEALEHAGIAPSSVAGTQTGVFVGMSGHDYLLLRAQHGGAGAIDPYYATGVSHSIASGRLSYFLGAHGPSVAVDTACSSSLYAAHLACQSLRAKESTMALAAGVNLMLVPEGFIAASQGRMLAPDGRCKTFDARADGYVRSEGCGVLVLRRLEDAVADGDRVLAVIKGTASNQDGRSNGITAPNGRAQEAVIRAALADAGVAPAQVGYVETHGTGTSLGDPIEVRAIGKVLGEERQKPILLGSVKTNLGHLEAAAGIAGLVKVVLGLYHKEIPPSIHFHEPNPLIPWEALPIQVPTEAVTWEKPAEAGRLAGISSFGFSGTNVHMIVEEAPEVDRSEPPTTEEPRLLPISAQSETALKELAGRYAEYLGGTEALVEDICFTAASGRSHFSHRLAALGSGNASLRQTLESFVNGEEPIGLVLGSSSRQRTSNPVFLFTGQGAQYEGMGQGLYERYPAFRRAIERCAAVLDPLLNHPLLSVLFPPEGEERGLINQTQYTQPALFAVEWALAQLWMSWGVKPSAVLGHSVGELVAACVAGVMTLEDGLRLIVERGRLMQHLPTGGAMWAVEANEAEARAAIEQGGSDVAGRVSIAAVNGPKSVVLSGEVVALNALGGGFAREGRQLKRLEVSHAFHSHLMEPMLGAFAEVAASITYRRPRVKLMSNVTGKEVRAAPTAEYWVRHLREPVQYARSVARLWEQGYRVFVEVGPQPVLIGMGRGGVDPRGEGHWVPSLRRNRNEHEQMLEAAATLYATGFDLEWEAVQQRAYRVALPSYPFQRQRYWIDVSRPTLLRHTHTNGKGSVHPLLGRVVRSPIIEGHVFESELGCHAPAFLDGHRIHGVPVLPATAYLEMGLAAARSRLGDSAFHVRDLSLHSALVLPTEGTRTVQCAVAEDGTFRVFSLSEDGEMWREHATGTIERAAAGYAAPTSVDAEALRERLSQREEVSAYYRMLTEVGAQYGGAFQAIAEVHRGEGEALGRLVVPNGQGAECYDVHPVLLDACFQLIGAAMPASSSVEQVHVPVAVGRLTVYRPGATEAWCHVVLKPDVDERGSVCVSLVLFTPAGDVIAEVDDLRLKALSPESLRVSGETLPPSDWLYEIAWHPEPLPAHSTPAFEHPGLWLVFADGQGVGDALAEKLEAVGNTCIRVVPGEYSEEDSTWRLDPARREDYDRLLAGVSATSEEALLGVVHLWSLDAPATGAKGGEVRSVDIGGLTHLQSALYVVQALLKAEQAPRLWYATRGAQRVEGDVAVPAVMQAPLWGLARTVAAEEPDLQCVRVDLDPAAEGDPAAHLFESVWWVDDNEEVAYRDQQRYVSRLERSKSPIGLEGWSWSEMRPFQLQLTGRGGLDNLTLVPSTLVPPGPGEIALRVHATGLNFRDVLNALGMYPGDAGLLGNEGAGTVVAVGEGVAEFQPGDEVVFLGMGTFSTYVTTDARLAAPKPRRLTFEESATVPVAFLTAYHGLVHLARLKQGERVLIHSAAGGVGMAAVRLAQQIGAEVFATAGSPRKRAYLRSLGVEHVMHSRTTEFAEEVLEATGGRGVDVVLNALTGEAIPKSLEVLAPSGRFLEIGKREIWTGEEVAAVNAAASYVAYDLADLMARDPRAIGEMLHDIVEMLEEGRLEPLPLRTFSMREVQGAFEYMARALHVGKVVVSQPVGVSGPASSEGRAPSDGADAWLRPDATYVITGGLGGLGLEVARRLAERGGRHLVLMSRRDPLEAGVDLRPVEEAGARVEVIQVDVAQADRLAEVMNDLARRMPPVRGIIHAAGVLDDGVLTQQEWSRFETVLAPKVGGAWNLHTLSKGLDLDFFVLFSSGSAVLGSPGQSSYAAANAFIDGLAAYRRARGLPGLSIQWGPWDEVGMAASLEAQQRARIEGGGVEFIQPKLGLEVFEALLRAGGTSPPQVAVLPINWGAMARRLSRVGSRMLLSGLLEDNAPSEAEERAPRLPDLMLLTPSERAAALVPLLRRHVAQVLRLNRDRVDADEPLTYLGLDSLVAVELKNQVERALGVAPSVSLLLGGATITHVADELSKLFQKPSPAPPALSGEDGTLSAAEAERALERIEMLSDEEVDALLSQMTGKGDDARE